MINLLRIFYRNGEVFNVKLNPLFFREKKLSISTRALDIAHARNPEPYKIAIYEDGALTFEKTIRKNDPAPLAETMVLPTMEQQKQQKLQRLKALKRMKKQWITAA